MTFHSRILYVGFPGPPFPVQTIKYTQSNLDLHQYRSDDSEVTPPAAFDPPDTTIDPGPDAIDPNDTVEQVRSPASPASQTITYKVQSASTIDGASAEPFAIAAAGPLTPLISPTVRPDGLDASPAAVRCNQPVTITAAAQNDSPDLAASGAALKIDLPAGVSLISGDATQVVSAGTLAASATSESHSWGVQASTEGTKTIVVGGAGDAYGTTFRDSDQVTINADCTPPGTSIDSGPAGPTNDPMPTFAFSGSGSPASFECSVDNSAFSGCSSPLTLSALADGEHSFRVRAVDAVGNADPAPPSRAFSVDTAPPDTAIESGPSGKIATSSASFGLVGGQAFECSLDGAAFTACGPSPTLTGLAQGSHSFFARAIDAAGNIDPTPASRAFAVDAAVRGARLRIRRSARFNGALALKVRVSVAEAGSVRVSAAGRARRKNVKARAARANLGSGPVMLKMTARRAVNRRIAAALEDGRVKLKVKATFTDAIGNRRTLRSSVKLR